MREYPCYIKINESEGTVFSTGMEFKTFITASPNKVDGFLLLKGFPTNARLNRHTWWEYVSKEDMDEFMKEDVYDYGDFCWIDFYEEADLEKLSDQNIAELLFAGHMKRPLGSPYFDVLKNHYLYLSHDDFYWVKIYMRDVREYKRVIEQKVREMFIGRKKSLTPMPENILNELYHLFTNGAVFDFENRTVSSIHTGVRIYPTRDIGLCAEEIHAELDRLRNLSKVGKYLEYNPKTKRWGLL